ncbi:MULTISPECIES: hypothetical protein [unclassified Bradyrhizobium]|uniref:hypothetical protein n=1 Tax=unclassified Bradyrhizobium TaxID=2631580 RepID=UPI001FF744DB|nr:MULTISPECIES: hypothetical protein [unclassified Bradyrhizobium]MCK1686458.1 hypothetical protein [Bradyrhizobium sp. 145]UPJ72984.1 hypothetical protein IVB19_36590 [Bradyrhizobium sp. 187]
MATNDETVAAITAYMAAPKRIIGYDKAPTWAPGFSVHEVFMKYPLEVGGELRGQLMVVGFPRQRDLKFRLSILMPGPLCRLDYTDETHPNSLDGYTAGLVPLLVTGPHYHSWSVNQRFFRGVTKPPELHDAVPYSEPGRTFDAILRWFCADTNIVSLPGGHQISLPEPSELL